MASTYSTNLKIELMGTGDQSGLWGQTANTNLGTTLEEAIVGRATANFASDADLTLTLSNSNASQVARAYVLNVTGTISTTRNLIVPTINKPYIVQNNTTGGQSITVKTSAGAGVTVPNGRETLVYADGTDVVAAVDYLPSLALGTDLAVADGGTGASDAAGARTNLGATTVGANLFTAANPSAVTFLRVNADNTVSLLSAADFRTAIGAGTGTGDVTLTGTQTLTNKTISADNNTISGIAASSFVLSNASGNIDGSAAQKAIPSGVVVGTTDTQTLTNKTLTSPSASDPTFTGAIYDNGSARSNITAVAALDINCSLGNYFTKTISSNSTFTVSNVPASRAYAFTLELTHTSGTVTWFSGVQWPGGTTPTLTTGKTHLFTFVTDDGGTRWRGVANINYTN